MRLSLPKAGQPQVIVIADPGERLNGVDRARILELFKQYGAIVLRGFVSDLADFGAFARSFCPLAVHNDSGKRVVLDRESAVQSVNLGNRAFPLHPELSREPWKPDVAFFYCITPPKRSGQTTICDGIAIVDALPSALRDEMAERRLKYLLPCPPAILEYWLGSSAPDDAQLATPPASCPYGFERQQSAVMRTFTRPLLHRTRFQDALAFGNFLLFARYLRGVTTFPLLDDMTPVPSQWVEEVKRVSDQLTVSVGWKEQDVVMVDNSRFMHGRTEVAMGDDRKIATYFGYLKDAAPDPEEPVDPVWRRPGFELPPIDLGQKGLAVG